MATQDSTCWTLIRGAAGGNQADRQEFARLYRPVVAAYLAARWRQSPLASELEDATQEVFVECFEEQGVLARADSTRPGGFRAFFYGVVRNVARRVETRRARRRETQADSGIAEIEGDDTVPPVAFDRAWARSIMRQAALLQSRRARQSGDGALRRVELLRLRFREGLPVREIARLWDEDAARVHHEYARARREFRAALLEVVASHHTGSRADVDAECARLLESLA